MILIYPVHLKVIQGVHLIRCYHIKAIAIKDGVSSAVTSRTYSKVEGGGDDEPGGDDH